MMADEVRKWLRQQSKDFYVAGFDALIKRWDKCISVGEGNVEKWILWFHTVGEFIEKKKAPMTHG
jgi:hypothetical protein